MFDKKLMQIPGIKKVVIILAFLAVVQALAIVLESVFLAIALVKTWNLQKIAALYKPMLLFFVAFVVRYAITWLEDKIVDHFSAQAVGYLKNKLLQKMVALGPKVINDFGSGNLITMTLEGLSKVKNYLDLIIIKAINMSIIPWIILAVIFYINFMSGVILLLVFPIIIIFMVILGLAAQRKSAHQYEGFKQMTNNFVDTMRGLETMKLLGLSKRYAQNIYQVSEAYRKSTMSVLKVALLSTFALDFFTTLSIAIVALFLGVRLINGEITLLPAMTVLILAPDYFLPVRDFGDDYHSTLDGKNALLDVFKILSMPVPTSKTKLQKFNQWNDNSTLSTHDLNFSYDGKTPTLSQLNFKTHGFHKIGIVGDSGAGKTTLLNILGGQLQPSNAEQNPLQVNNEKVDSLSQSNWQKHTSYIPQDPYIFAGTIADNIAFYKPDATKSEIRRAAKEAGLDNFINSLKDGLETKIGEQGRGISGGQAQRIALARTLLDQKRNILLLDEPTAHLDIETEYKLRHTMLPVFKKRLVFLATHRLHWMNQMDYILVLKDGKIVEQGTPTALKNKAGEYQRLINQIRGDKKDED